MQSNICETRVQLDGIVDRFSLINIGYIMNQSHSMCNKVNML